MSRIGYGRLGLARSKHRRLFAARKPRGRSAGARSFVTSTSHELQTLRRKRPNSKPWFGWKSWGYWGAFAMMTLGLVFVLLIVFLAIIAWIVRA